MSRPKPYKGSENYIFASYAHKDREKVFETIYEMQQKGYRIWFDAAIRPGHDWDDELADKIDGCSCFIAFMSENYKNSENCKDELNYARDHEKTRVLILLEPVDLSRGGLAMRNNRAQQISKFSYDSSEDFFEDFSEANNVASCLTNDPQPVAALPPVTDSVKSLNTSADGGIAVGDAATKASAEKTTGDTCGTMHDVEKSDGKAVGGSVIPDEMPELISNNTTTGAAGTEGGDGTASCLADRSQRSAAARGKGKESHPGRFFRFGLVRLVHQTRQGSVFAGGVQAVCSG